MPRPLLATALVLASLSSAGVLLPVLRSEADGETKMTLLKFAYDKLGQHLQLERGSWEAFKAAARQAAGQHWRAATGAEKAWLHNKGMAGLRARADELMICSIAGVLAGLTALHAPQRLLDAVGAIQQRDWSPETDHADNDFPTRPIARDWQGLGFSAARNARVAIPDTHRQLREGNRVVGELAQVGGWPGVCKVLGMGGWGLLALHGGAAARAWAMGEYQLPCMVTQERLHRSALAQRLVMHACPGRVQAEEWLVRSPPDDTWIIEQTKRPSLSPSTWQLVLAALRFFFGFVLTAYGPTVELTLLLLLRPRLLAEFLAFLIWRGLQAGSISDYFFRLGLAIRFMASDFCSMEISKAHARACLGYVLVGCCLLQALLSEGIGLLSIGPS